MSILTRYWVIPTDSYEYCGEESHRRYVSEMARRLKEDYDCTFRRSSAVWGVLGGLLQMSDKKRSRSPGGLEAPAFREDVGVTSPPEL